MSSVVDSGDYEVVDHDDPSMKSADIRETLKKMNMELAGKPLILPPTPSKSRYTKEPGKKPQAPPPTATKPTPSIQPPTISRKPSPGKLSNYEKKTRNVILESSDQHISPIPTPYLRSVSPAPPPIPSRVLLDGATPSNNIFLPEFVRKYSKELPIRVRVEEGFCGSEERFVISAGDVYNFHFVKNEKVVSVKDCGGAHFSIPLNSEMQFGLLYHPSGNFKDAINGHIFNSVSELVSASSPPRLVRVTGSPHTSPTRTTVNKNDLLLVKKTGKTMLRKPFAKVYSFNTKEEKTINDDCEYSFTTEPQNLKLYLPEILEHFPDSFPLECMMYAPGEDSEDFPLHLTTDMVTLTHTSIESSIIATTQWGEDDGPENEDEEMPISIPIEMEIEICIVEDTNEEDLYTDTKTLLEHLDFSKIKNMKTDAAGDTAEGGVGVRFSSRARKGYEFRGVALTMSEKVYSDPGLSQALPFRSAVNQPLPPTPGQSLPGQTLPPQQKSPIPPTRFASNNKTPNSNRLSLSDGAKAQPIPPPRGRSLDDASTSPRPERKQRSSTLGEDSLVKNQELYMNMPSSAKSLPPETISEGVDSADSAEVKALKSLVESMKKEMEVMRGEMARVVISVEMLKDDQRKLQARVEISQGQGEAKPPVLPKASSSHTKPPPQTSHAKPPPQTSHTKPPPQTSHAKSPPQTSHAKLDYQNFNELEKTTDPVKQEENRANLKAMGVQEILYLLDVMKLTQYRQGFVDESIDGEILAECDEDLLEHELHITNKLHRSRIMKIISGRHSASNIQHGLDPYGRV